MDLNCLNGLMAWEDMAAYGMGYLFWVKYKEDGKKLLLPLKRLSDSSRLCRCRAAMKETIFSYYSLDHNSQIA
jgi:hypothetical protein